MYFINLSFIDIGIDDDFRLISFDFQRSEETWQNYKIKRELLDDEKYENNFLD
jgi:hypothetical protein